MDGRGSRLSSPLLLGMLTLVLGLALVGRADAAKRQPPPLQALAVTERIQFDLPSEYAIFNGGNDTGEGNGGVELAPDDEHLIVIVNHEEKSQIGIARFDGSEFRCLTCGLSKRATKPTVLADGKRIWFSDNAGGGLGEQQWAILECEPTIYNCQQARKVDVKFPIDSLSEGTGAQNREAKPDDFGEYVLWNEVGLEDGTKVAIARLVRGASEYELVDQRIVSPQFDVNSNDPRDWINGGRFYEGGDFVGGNRFLKYQTTTTGLNYDTTLVDLRTGKRRFITTDRDYNELANYSPDGRWVFYSSARGLDRMNVFTQLIRPPFLDFVAFGQMGRVGLWNNRRCMNEMWLMHAGYGQHRGGYAGQPVVLDENWNIRRVDWFEEGQRAMITETRLPNMVQPTDPAKRTKTMVVKMPALKPHDPPKTLRINWDAVKKFTVPAAEYKGMAARQVSNHTIKGPGGGTATFNFSGSLLSGTWSVTYNGYSSDGKTFLTGTESVTTPLVSLSATWKADLVQRGAHKGYLRGELTIEGGKTFTGTVESEVDGVRKSGVPTQEDCPGLYKPSMRARVVKRTALPGGRLGLRVLVDTKVPGDAKRRPIAGVRVSLGGKNGRTDNRGTALLTIQPRAGKRYPLRARSAGFRTVARTVGGFDQGGSR